jgi:acetyl esterase
LPPRRNEHLHPESRALLERADAENAPALETLTPEEARGLRTEPMKQNAGFPEPLLRVEDWKAPGPHGEIPLRLYAPEADGAHPALVYFHGGGFVVGNIETHDPVCRALAKASGSIVVSVDYRLAPEFPFPVPVEDAFAATQWLISHAAELGIDAARISVGGDSAGGGLATVVAMRCRDQGVAAVRSQVLIYPVTDLSSFETGSYREFAEGYNLTRAAMQWFAGHYLSSPADALTPEASPLLAGDLRGLPPALVITAEIDPLRDEGEAYAERLRQAGVPVTLTRYPGMLHAFVSLRGVISGGQRAIEQIGEYLRSQG